MMNHTLKPSFGITIITVLTFVFSNATFADVVLTFDQDDPGNGTPLDFDYGDRVTAATDANGYSYGIIQGNGFGLTPNVELSYAGADPRIWTTNYGDLTNVLYNETDGDSFLAIRFQADPGFEVGIYGFDLGAFGSGETLPAIAIAENGSNSALWLQQDIALPGSGAGRSSFDTGGIFGEDLFLTLDLRGLGGASDNIGIDNIHFAQRIAAVPEPASGCAVLLVVAGLIVRRRRQSTCPR